MRLLNHSRTSSDFVQFSATLPTGEDAKWIDTVASPTMSREDVVLWMEAYQLGVPMSTLMKGWEEL